MCALYTTTSPSSALFPYTYHTNTSDACACYRACRQAYACDGRFLCANGPLRTDCRQAAIQPDSLGGANPFPTQ